MKLQPPAVSRRNHHHDEQIRHRDHGSRSSISSYLLSNTPQGPAGAGKSTFCAALIQHLQNNKRPCYYVNLDPAAEDFAFAPDIDIKDLISLSDVMEEMGLGPNGGLIYCFEFLLENLDFLTEPLDAVTEEYLIVFDMPGQIELYTHVPILPRLVQHLTGGSLNIRMCAAYLLEATFMIDRPKFFAGTLSAMSAMLMLEMPHVNVLSKMDLVKGQVPRRDLKRFIDPDAGLIDDDDSRYIGEETLPVGSASKSNDPANVDNVMGGSSFHQLNKAVAQLIDDFSMVSFLQLDVQNEDSVGAVLSYIDDAIQYHEAQEPREPVEEEPDARMEE
jgi:GTPase SAR1 family protein